METGGAVRVDETGLLRIAEPGTGDQVLRYATDQDNVQVGTIALADISDYTGFQEVNSTATVGDRSVSFIGFVHTATASVAVFDEVGGLAIGGRNFVTAGLPTGPQTFTGMNILRYSNSPVARGQIQDGTFTLTSGTSKRELVILRVLRLTQLRHR